MLFLSSTYLKPLVVYTRLGNDRGYPLHRAIFLARHGMSVKPHSKSDAKQGYKLASGVDVTLRTFIVQLPAKLHVVSDAGTKISCEDRLHTGVALGYIFLDLAKRQFLDTFGYWTQSVHFIRQEISI